MFISAKNKEKYSILTLNDIKFNIKELKSVIALIEDEKIINDDLTQEELDKGLKEVEKICKENNNLELLKEYYKLHYKDDNINLLIKLKELKLFEVNNNYNIEIDKVLKEYVPNTEILTWDIQETESRAFKENNYQDDSLCPFMKKNINYKKLSFKRFMR